MDTWQEVGKFAFGRLHPNNNFLASGNVFCCFSHPMAVFQSQDDESFRKEVSCADSDCSEEFTSLAAAEVHYDMLHRHCCPKCRQSFPSEHLLDIHVGADALSHQKSLFRCFLRTCPLRFESRQLMLAHCQAHHLFPPDILCFEPCHVLFHPLAMKELQLALPKFQ